MKEETNRFIDQTKAHAWGPTKQPLAGKKKIQVKTAPGPGLAAFGGDSSLSSQGQDVLMVWEGHDCWLVDPVDGSGSSFLIFSYRIISSFFVVLTWQCTGYHDRIIID